MSSVIEKALGILELLTEDPDGYTVSEIAARTGQPMSGVHRQLNEFARLGYVRQHEAGGRYSLSLKLAAMGLNYLTRCGISDFAQPVLDKLAQASHELVRLSVVDGSKLIWVAAAQGATTGLRYDPGPEQGMQIHLASTAGGLAWLSTMDDDQAIALVSMQGLRSGSTAAGLKVVESIAELQTLLATFRKQGYAYSANTYTVGLAAMAMPVRNTLTGTVVGCVSIAGPYARLNEDRARELSPTLKQAATELGAASSTSSFFTHSAGLKQAG
ncbi:IclR family transcriptional regulator [uncultured Roseibium sp.]|uniref:IclR family transcriptional regulator n=1 Tax=uncultured Roseibium sp. TaxID=1936171 RepID=UPI0032177DF7